MKLVAGAASDVGRQREVNEDGYLIDDHLALFAVADGMGGHRGGEVASATALEALRASVGSTRPIDVAIRFANREVFDRGTGDVELHGMGTTLTAVVAVGGSTLLVGHVGDSRAYLLRAGELAQVTDDHSLVEELVREGRLTRPQAEVHPQRSIITRALGVEPDVRVDLHLVEVVAGDRILLCSDGLTSMLRDEDIARVLTDEADPRVAADALVDAANDAGGDDNITVLVLDVLEVDDDHPPDPGAIAGLAAPGADPDATGVMTRAEDAPGAGGPDGAEAEPGSRADAGPADDLPVGRRSIPRRIVGIALVVVPLAAIVAVAIGVVRWQDERTYFVGLDGDDVVLFRGTADRDPVVERRTDLTVDDLTEADAALLAEGAAAGSLATAEGFLDRLEERAADATTTTTRPPVTTVPRAPATTTTTSTGATRPRTPAPAPPTTG